MPNFDVPVGYDGKNYRDAFKTKDELPFLTTETVEFDGRAKKIENRLIWGDNLAVMRALPSESIDLIYVDPPFFSGKDYNKIFGDDDEVRTFSDIWDGGLPTYLAWLNARLWEMKRLLKPTGSIYVHLDWHVSHYAKCEMDKIFGTGGKDGNAPGFKANIIWSYSWGVRTENRWNRKHDDILFYTKSKDFVFNASEVLEDRKLGDSSKKRLEYKGALIKDHNKRGSSEKALPTDVWHVPTINGMAAERIGYPTQKPEALIEKVILASSNPGDVVADFFSGGGTTVAVAEKLGRKWIGTDISRIAISVARDRLMSVYEKEAGIKSIKSTPTFGFSVDYHGIYERDQVRELEPKDYILFILNCYGGIAKKQGDNIHGYKDGKAIFVAPSKTNLKNHQIEEFCADLVERKIQNGVILAWNISKEAEKYVADLRKGSSGVDIQIVQVKLVDIDSNEFKGDNIRFINKPAALIRKSHKAGLTWVFDATASCGSNGSDIHYYQWDFNYKNKFSPSTKPNFKSDSDGDGNPLNDYRKIEYTFPEEGEFTVALRVFDKSGAEAITITKISVSKKSSKAS